jgi:hypothetical protein
LKKLGILGAVTGAIALLVFVRQPNAKESDETEIRAMEAAMITAYAAKDLDNALAGYVQDETLFVFDAIPPRQYVGINAGGLIMRASSRCSRDRLRRKCPI